MSFFKFSINNLVRNKRTYFAHFLSSAFAVFIFYIYAMLQFHPDLQGQILASRDTISQLGKMGMQVSQGIIFLFSFFFLLYSVSSFLKVRKREFGTLLLLGMSKKQLNRLLFFENIIIGIVALITGLIIGLVFSKIILLLMSRLLVLRSGLQFYMPWKASGVTFVMFLILFVGLAAFTSVLLKKDQIANLLRAEDQPKREPKASPLRSVLALVLIGLGYAAIFRFAVYQNFYLWLLAAGVGFVIWGTYFLFTQLSVYTLKKVRKSKSLYLRKTNMLFFSELMYRLKDNSIMFFLISIITAAAFTGIGSSLALGDPGLEQMQNPYAFTYTYFEKDDKNISVIEDQLTRAGFDYKMVNVTNGELNNGHRAVKLSEYNQLLTSLGYDQETLENGEAILAPSSYNQKNIWRLKGFDQETIPLQLDDSREIEIKVKKLDNSLALANMDGNVIVLPDDSFISLVGEGSYKRAQFVMENWVDTYEVAQELNKKIGDSYLDSLILNWYYARQTNGILLMVSGLVGVVFFVYAASFIYFRLYSDLERDQKQYEVIRKVGLTVKELRQIMSRQLLLMFFFPMVIALIHSTVAFLALQQLVEFSVWNHVLKIYLFFLTIQVIYFFIMRWRYLKVLEQKI